ncbi:MAG TPA: MFS transporter [Burkholderiaceae bacterium]|jgi:MFS family permease
MLKNKRGDVSLPSTPAPRWRFSLSPDDLLRDMVYRRLWISILTSSFGASVMVLALPLTSALLLHATPQQMGYMTFAEILPLLLFSLPAGVWLDRMPKLPVYIAGETAMASAMLSVPLAWWGGWLSMTWMYLAGFMVGTIQCTAGAASQVVLTQVVDRSRLVEAHSRNSLAMSAAEVCGPSLAGALIGLVGAPLALVLDAMLMLSSALILGGMRIRESLPERRASRFLYDLKEGLHFVTRHRMLFSLSLCVSLWQLCYSVAVVVHILFATRVLGLSAQQIGLSYTGLGIGTIAASLWGNRISRRIGPGPCLLLGLLACGLAWDAIALAPVNTLGKLMYPLTLLGFGCGAVFITVNFYALRQAVTPAPLLGRMTSITRWLTLLPGAPGALLGGWIGESFGLRYALGFAGMTALLLAVVAWRFTAIRKLRELPTLAA